MLALLIPSLWVLYLSFHKGGILEPAQFVGLANWQAIFKDRVALLAIRNTLLYMLMAIPTVFAIGLCLAMLLKRDHPRELLLQGDPVFPHPHAVRDGRADLDVRHPPRLRGLELSVASERVQRGELARAAFALVSVAMLEVWRGIGFWTLLFLAALVSLPEELYQAAKVDGARSFSQFWHITLPLLPPTFVFAVVMATIWNFQVFDSIIILTDGAPNNGTASVGLVHLQADLHLLQRRHRRGDERADAGRHLLLTMVQLRVLRRRWKR